MFKKLRCTHEWHIVSSNKKPNFSPGTFYTLYDLYCPKCKKVSRKVNSQKTAELLNRSILDKEQQDKHLG